MGDEGRWLYAAGGTGRGMDSAVWDLVQEETGMLLRGGANGELLLAVVQERV